MSEYRLSELATLSGVSIRNIRAYRERGLLDPPRRQGRAAFYEDRHLAQLRTVNELLRRGFTSAHIAEFLDSARQGRDLADILGLQSAIFGPAPHGTAVDVDPDGDDARRLRKYGLAEVVDGELTLLNPGVAEILGAVSDQEPYVQAMLRVSEDIADLLDELAAAVAGAVQESAFARFGPDHVSLPDDRAELRRMVAVGRRVVADQLEGALQRHLSENDPADVAVSGVGTSPKD